MDHTQPPADHAVREAALNPTRSFIVEAPAGSGKTELLTRRYLRLLACVSAPEEILAITFTRKAAAEMRGRIVKALSLAESDTPPTDTMKLAVWSLAKAVRTADEQHGWQLLSHPARLRIMTIDALNSSLARQLPILSGAGATLAIARDTTTLYAEVVLRLAERLSGRDANADAIARLLKHLDNRYDVFESLLSRELARREHWLDIGLMRFEMPALRSRLESALSDVVSAELAQLRELIPRDAHKELTTLITHAAAVLNSVGAESPIATCDSLTELPSASSDSLTQWQGIAELLLTKEGEWRVRLDRKIGFPPEEKMMKQRLAALLQRLQSEPELSQALHRARQLPLARYDDTQWQALADLLEVLKLGIAELEVVMRERGETDFVANAIAARRALGTINEPTEFALRLDYRLQHVLVDEFQDTSRGQVELLALLTAGWTDGDGRTLFCVGDPMQSIYRFRHADVGLFLNLKRHGLNQLRLIPLRLSVNFRSARSIIEWINSTFVQTLPRHDDPERGAVAFTDSEPRVAADASGGVFVHAIVGDKFQARSEEAKQIGALIAQSLQSSNTTKIAVLVSNRLHLQYIVRELQALHIAFQAVEIDPLARRPVIQDLVALTRALVHLADRTAWFATLRAPWCGLSLSDLHSLGMASEAGSETLWLALNDTMRIEQLSADGQARVLRIRPVLQRAVRIRGRVSLRDCVERTWRALGGPATVSDAAALNDSEAYFARLEEIERAGDLEDSARLEDALTDLYANGDAMQARVELMTIHKAKGLEFDVVILPALDSGARGDEPPLVRVQELPQLDGERALLLAPIAPRGGDKEEIYAWLEQLDKERASLEQGRLLYVAATRAVRELHLFGAVEPDGKPRANTFLHLLWPIVASHFSSSIPAAIAVSPQSVTTIRTMRLPLTWQPPSPEVHTTNAQIQDVVENEPLHPEFEWVGETARHVGTLVHRELERIARVGIDHAEVARNASQYSTLLAELGVPPHLRDAAAARVQEALSKMLNDERGRWLLADENTHRDVFSELALSGVIGGDIVNGIIDRTFVARDGTRWLVDFKTSTHAGSGLDEFLSREVERYRPQLERYAMLMRGFRPDEPIKTALYFPLLGAWREVDLD